MRISVVQLAPGSNKLENIQQAEAMLEQCVAADAPDLVLLPEVWTCLGGDRAAKFDAAESVPQVGSPEAGGTAFEFLRRMARRHGIHVHGGSIGETCGDRLLNTSVVFDPDGNLIGRYSKIHLFDITTPNGAGYRESDTYRPGEEVVTVELGGRFASMKMGLAICYDIRFAELFIRLRQQGADIILLPAAFTFETGEAHWEILLRARAIETQCWLAAAGTVGAHQDAEGKTRLTYGNSMIVDPWGVVTARASSGAGWATGRVELTRTEWIRAGIPVMAHRRVS